MVNLVMRAAHGVRSLVRPTGAARWLARRFFRVRAAQAEEWEERIPAPERTERIEGGLAVHFWGSGRKVLLVPGWRGRHSRFAFLVPALVRAGFQPVAFDLHGMAPAAGRHADPSSLGEAVRTAARRFGPFHGAVGHGLGGMALMVALARGLHVNRVILIAAPASLRDVLIDAAGSYWYGRRARAALLSVVEGAVGIPLDDLEARRLCAARTEPVLIVHDEEDEEVPVAHARGIAAAWPGSKIQTARGLGHIGILANDAVCNRIAEFLISYGR